MEGALTSSLEIFSFHGTMGKLLLQSDTYTEGITITEVQTWDF